MPRSQTQRSSRALTAVGINTPSGKFIAHFSERGLAQLVFPHRDAPAPGPPVEFSAELNEWISLTEKAVLDVLSGRPPLQLPPLDMSAGSVFQQRVWSALRGLAKGQTKSYGEIAAEIGSPKATRAVGAACGANPIPVLVPCHRVLAANAKLGGFSGGLDWKLRLLAVEDVTLV